MSLFLETIAIINRMPQHIDYHQKRVDTCSLVQLEPFLNRITVATSQKYKLSIVFNETQVDKYQLIPYYPIRIESFKLLIDNYIDYSFKYADRTHLDKLKAKKGNCDEVIIIKNEEVTDCTFANLIFYNGQQWVTPKNPLLKGTCRARLIENGFITPQIITVQELSTYTKMMLINAMLDFDESRAIQIDQGTFLF